MTSTLKTEMRAVSNARAFIPTGALKSVCVEGSKTSCEAGRVLALNCNGGIGKAYRLT